MAKKSVLIHLRASLFLVIITIMCSSCVEKADNVSRKALLRIDEIFLISRDGSLIKMLDYEDAGEFSGGLAAVKKESGLWGYIDQNANEVITARFEEAHPFSCDRAVVKINGLYGIIDRKGSIIPSPLNDPRITPALKFSEGFLSFETEISCNKRMIGIIDANGKELIAQEEWDRDELWEEICAPFSEGYCAFNGIGGTVVVDTRGNARKFDCYIVDGQCFSHGLLPAIDRESRLRGYVDYEGNWVIKPIYRHASPFSEGLAFVRFEDEDYENEEGRTVWVSHAIDEYGKIQFSHHSGGWPEPFSCGMAKVWDGRSEAYFIDKKGNKVLGRDWYFASDFCDGYTWIWMYVRGNFVAQIIDIYGEAVSEPIYEPMQLMGRVEDVMLSRIKPAFLIDDYRHISVASYSVKKLTKLLNIVAMLPKDKLLYNEGDYYGVCDENSNIIIPVIYLFIVPSEEGYLVCENSGNRDGIIDYSGRNIIGYDYWYIDKIYYGRALAYDDKTWIINVNGDRYKSPEELRDIGYGNMSIERQGLWYPCDFNMNVIGEASNNRYIPIYKEIFYVINDEMSGFLYDCKKKRRLTECEDTLKTDDKYIPVKKNGKWGYVDRSGKVKIEPQYDQASQFKNEVACVVLGKKTGFIDRKGAPVAPFIRGEYLMRGKHKTYSSSGHH